VSDNLSFRPARSPIISMIYTLENLCLWLSCLNKFTHLLGGVTHKPLCGYELLNSLCNGVHRVDWRHILNTINRYSPHIRVSIRQEARQSVCVAQSHTQAHIHIQTLALFSHPACAHDSGHIPIALWSPISATLQMTSAAILRTCA
jgi:hypothetical protein